MIGVGRDGEAQVDVEAGGGRDRRIAQLCGDHAHFTHLAVRRRSLERMRLRVRKRDLLCNQQSERQ